MQYGFGSANVAHAASVVSIAEHSPEPPKVRVAGITQRYQNGSKTPLTALEAINLQIQAGIRKGGSSGNTHHLFGMWRGDDRSVQAVAGKTCPVPLLFPEEAAGLPAGTGQLSVIAPAQAWPPRISQWPSA